MDEGSATSRANCEVIDDDTADDEGSRRQCNEPG